MTLKLGFLDTTFADYTPATPSLAPLGGTQSAACHLAAALARAGAEVTLITGTAVPARILGVDCRPAAATPPEMMAGFDALVVLGGCPTDGAMRMGGLLNSGRKRMLWIQHAVDESAVANLADPAFRCLWDGFIFVSRWQRRTFIVRFGLQPWRCHVLRNAAAPCFGDLFGPGEDPAAAKSWPPVLAYTSAPFRGLDVLLDAMPRIRAALPGTVLRVFSSLRGYQVPADQDPYAALYDRCRAVEGVEYVGGLPQPALAAALRGVTALAYPNRFAETSCIAVMEAMAAGCLVVSSHLGALAETGAGFARLMPVPTGKAEHAERFAAFLCDALARQRARPEVMRQDLRAQIDHVDAARGWDRRAALWLALLSDRQAGAQAGSPAGLLTAARSLTVAGGPGDPVALLLDRLGSALRRGDRDAAADRCAEVLAMDPAHAPVWRLQAQIAAAEARFCEAATALGRAHRLAGPVPAAEWAGWLPRILSGIAGGDDGQPLPARMAALEDLAPVVAGQAAATLVGAARHLATSAQSAGDFATMARACRMVAERVPADSGIRIAGAWALVRLGRHADAVDSLVSALRIDNGPPFGGREARAMVAQCLEEVEVAAVAGITAMAPPSAAALLRGMATVAAALGEDAEPARQAAAIAGDPSRPDRDRRLEAQMLRLLAARRLAQKRRADQVELLSRAAALGVDGEAPARLNRARLALAQRQMLEALGTVLNEGANGRAGPRDWQGEARDLIALIEQSMRLDLNEEGERSSLWGTVRGYAAFLAYVQATGPGMPPLPPPPVGGRRVYDCFPFFNELDLLELRLAELDGVVDRFVLVEATHTHAGLPKPLHYAENAGRFAAHAHKIIHVVVEDDPGGFAWLREAHQREAIGRGLVGCAPDDLVIIGDADEILRPETITRMRHAPATSTGLFAPHLDIYLYFLNLRSPDPWVSVAAAPFELVRRVGTNTMRYLAKQGIGEVVPSAGWHFTWMGGIDRFLAKLDAFAHREMIAGFDHDRAANRARLERFFATGSVAEGAVPGMWTALTRVDIDDSFPAALRARLDDFARLGWIAPERAG
ncbi:MAG: hypothetical protein RLY86_1022 [Pseudomonadota bacterium]|jgi:hypothetical protein